MRKLFLLALLLPLGGCVVGPDFAGPPEVAPIAGQAPNFVRAGDVADGTAPPIARWWETLGDPTLNALEERALAASPNLAIAEARLLQARATLRLERAEGLPKVNAQATAVYARIPGVDLGSNNAGNAGAETSSLELYNLGFDASWEIDLFGGRRRETEAAQASLEAAQANVADAQVSLTADVALAYVNLRDRQERIAIERRSLEMQQQMLELAQQRVRQGTASALDVERLRAQVASASARTASLDAEVETLLNAIAVATGEEPGTLDAMLSEPRQLPLPPRSVSVGDPAAMLRRRPDIRAAERRLAAYTARIGVAEAARFPRLNLMGIIGIGGTQLSDLTHLDDFASIAAPMLQWSFVDFGRNRARVRQAEAVRDEALAQYEATVLGALNDAEDALARFRHRRAAVASLARARESAGRATDLMRQRYRAGTVTLIERLEAERQLLAAGQSLSEATAGLTAAYIALQKALGLGWADTGSHEE